MKITRKLQILLRMSRSYVGYKLGRPKPFICSYYTTLRCNLNCPYCPTNQDFKSKTDEYKKTAEMNTEDAKRAIKRVSSLGVSILSFSGGESLLRDDIEELGSYAKSLGMSSILYTNGTLIDKQKSLSTSKSFDSITISLPEIKDDCELRSLQNLEQVEKSLELLRDKNVKVGVSFVINKYSIDKVEEIADYVKDKADFLLYIPVHYAPEYFPSEGQTKDIEERMLKIKRKHGDFISNSKEYIETFSKYLKGEKVETSCTAFDLYISLAPNGDLQGCSFPFPVGNVLDDNVENLLEKGRDKRGQLKEKCPGGVLEGCGQLPILFQQSIFESLLSATNIIKILLKNE